MVTHWGMSERLGPVSYKTSEEDPFLGREIHQQRQFSEHTMEVIDQEVTRILQQASKVAYKLLQDHEEDLRNLAEQLLQEEELDEPAIAKIIGRSVHNSAEQEQAAESTKPVIPTTSQPTSDSSATAQQVTRDHHGGDVKSHDNPAAPPPASSDN